MTHIGGRDTLLREATLEKWLAAPGQFVPGSRMGFSVATPPTAPTSSLI